jgi:ribosomal protein S18 acetylase RimI-like enzyme
MSGVYPEFTVRKSGPGDARGLISLYGELADGRVNAEPADLADAERILEEIGRQRDRLLLVAEDTDGDLVGTVDILVIPNLTHHGHPWAVVENVVVLGKRRRDGVGRALMEEAMAHAASSGCYKVQLQSAKHRDQAHAFYRSLGFEAVSEGFKLLLE